MLEIQYVNNNNNKKKQLLFILYPRQHSPVLSHVPSRQLVHCPAASFVHLKQLVLSSQPEGKQMSTNSVIFLFVVLHNLFSWNSEQSANWSLPRIRKMRTKTSIGQEYADQEFVIQLIPTYSDNQANIIAKSDYKGIC